MPERLCRIQTEENGIAVVAVPGGPAATARQLLEALQRQIVSLSGHAEIRGVVLTAPDGAFGRCSLSRDEDPALLAAFGQQVMFNLERLGKPCVAAIAGECSGVGLELALASDFIVASEGAQFGFPAIAEGVITFCGGSQRLARLVGKSKAKELILGGEMIAAAEALRIRLINRLYPAGELLQEAVKLLGHICGRSPNAIRVGGEVINAGYDIDLQTACMLERNAFALCFAHFDQREGMQSFLDKRQPQFSGE